MTSRRSFVAGWRNEDYKGLYLTVELSPRFVARTQVDQDDIIGSLVNDKEDHIEGI
jgi:hypothetical protein